MVQYLHFRILDFPLIIPYLNQGDQTWFAGKFTSFVGWFFGIYKIISQLSSCLTIIYKLFKKTNGYKRKVFTLINNYKPSLNINNPIYPFTSKLQVTSPEGPRGQPPTRGPPTLGRPPGVKSSGGKQTHMSYHICPLYILYIYVCKYIYIYVIYIYMLYIYVIYIYIYVIYI